MKISKYEKIKYIFQGHKVVKTGFKLDITFRIDSLNYFICFLVGAAKGFMLPLWYPRMITVIECKLMDPH